MTTLEILNLEDLIKPYIGDKEILKTSVSCLTSPGDNYSGILLRVDINLENEGGEEEAIHAVAKLIPRNEFMQQVFNVQVTCHKEIAFYKEIVPALQKFQEEVGAREVINLFPDFYGARVNLDGGEKVDENSVILLENLSEAGYVTIDRLKGFDLETSKIVLKNLAKFHGVPLALKMSRPAFFEEKIKPFLIDQYPHGGVTPHIVQILMMEFLEGCNECEDLMPKLKEIIERPRHENFEERNEPFLTIAHGDMWVNNVMVKFEDNKAITNKFIDFQNFAYRSPAVDLFLLLWTSVQKNVLEENLDDLLEFYHQHLIEYLQQYKCDVSEFTYENFLEKMKVAAKYGVPHSLFMIIFVVFCKKEVISIDQSSNKLPHFGTKEDITPEAKDRVLYMIQKCNERDIARSKEHQIQIRFQGPNEQKLRIEINNCLSQSKMTFDKIEELDKLLKSYIGESKSITGVKISRLTGPGENYGSTLLKVDITLKNKADDTREELHAVAKLIPEVEFFQKLFNIQETCKAEILMYDTIIPTLQQFQRDRGIQKVIDFFPKMIASRINLNGSDVVDENAVLMMENLTEAGYKNVNRFESFDLPTIKLILKDLAAFHAVPLALKLLEPEIFKSKIQPYLTEKMKPPSIEGKGRGRMDLMREILKSDEVCRPVVSKLKDSFTDKLPQNEPFVTVGHGDLWVNNIMIKFENGQPVSNIFLDFQNPKYMTPAVDLFFLLWTSVKMDVLKGHFDELVRFYHDNFIEQLRQLNCDQSPFSFDKFLDELKSVITKEVGHVFFFTAAVIFSKTEDGEKPKVPHEKKLEDVSDIAKERIICMTRTCVEKGWL